jgi:PTS system galactitol-specific IIA component
MSTTTGLEVVAGLSLVRPQVTDAQGVLRLVAQHAQAAGYVRPSFAGALVDREVAYPTGLPTPVPVAIPHADPEHVLRPALAAVLLDPAVPFGEMGSTDRTVDVRLAVVLMVTDPAGQTALLGRLITALRRPDLADLLVGVQDPRALADVVGGLLADDG